MQQSLSVVSVFLSSLSSRLFSALQRHVERLWAKRMKAGSTPQTQCANALTRPDPTLRNRLRPTETSAPLSGPFHLGTSEFRHFWAKIRLVSNMYVTRHQTIFQHSCLSQTQQNSTSDITPRITTLTVTMNVLTSADGPRLPPNPSRFPSMPKPYPNMT